MKNLTKKRYVILVTVIVLILVPMDYYGQYIKPYYCGYQGHLCKSIYNEILALGVILVPIFISSLIAYRLPEKLFQKFIRFTCYSYIPYATLVLITSWNPYGGGFGPGPELQKGLVAWILSMLYFLIALMYILVLYKKSK